MYNFFNAINIWPACLRGCGIYPFPDTEFYNYNKINKQAGAEQGHTRFGVGVRLCWGWVLVGLGLGWGLGWDLVGVGVEHTKFDRNQMKERNQI